MHTVAVEDYLKAIYKLGAGGVVSSTALADKIGFSAAAVTKMQKHLAGMGLVTYEPYRGVQLTDSGLKSALEVIRHHRLLEQYLVEAMGYSWDEVDAEAERLEHVISEEFEKKIDTLLGYPATCPHGDPIPSIDGAVADRRLTRLAQCSPGQTVRVARVKDSDSSVLRTLTAHQIGLNSAVTVIKTDESLGTVTVRVGFTEHCLDLHVAESVFVEVEGAE